MYGFPQEVQFLTMILVIAYAQVQMYGFKYLPPFCIFTLMGLPKEGSFHNETDHYQSVRN